MELSKRDSQPTNDDELARAIRESEESERLRQQKVKDKKQARKEQLKAAQADHQNQLQRKYTQEAAHIQKEEEEAQMKLKLQTLAKERIVEEKAQLRKIQED